MSRIVFAAKNFQKQLNDIAHKHTIICRQLFAGHVVGSRPMKRKEETFASNDNSSYCTYHLLWSCPGVLSCYLSSISRVFRSSFVIRTSWIYSTFLSVFTLIETNCYKFLFKIANQDFKKFTSSWRESLKNLLLKLAILCADISQHDKKRRAGTGERDHALSQITRVPLFSQRPCYLRAWETLGFVRSIELTEMSKIHCHASGVSTLLFCSLENVFQLCSCSKIWWWLFLRMKVYLFTDNF